MLLKKTHLLDKVKEFLNIKEEVSFNKNKISNLCKELEDIKKSIDNKNETISNLNKTISNLNKTIVKLESQNKLITNDIVIISAALKDLYTILLKEYGYSESDIFEFFKVKKKKIDYHWFNI